ncbi:MAG TPA: xanthan lyase [Sphingobacteriaceae bacterium]|nr:xanthan lyase [Sphingobacteriaceae bacterium]
MQTPLYHFILSLIFLFPGISIDPSQGNRAKNLPAAASYEAEIIIYGGTSAAVIAAVEAVKLGKSVIMVSPDKHLGGVSSSGLGFTDTGNKAVIGGLAREFYHRVYLHYQQDKSWKWQKKDEYGNKGQGTPAIDGNERTMWIFEPHVAEQIFGEFINEYKIKVFRNEWLDRAKGIVVKNKKIMSLRTLSGKVFKGKVFIDATYEGDLMAASGVKYFVGRESNSTYSETWNGVQAGVFQHGHYFKKNIDPYRTPGDKSSGLLPGISSSGPGKNGDGDKKLQAYCFRLCLTDKLENRVPFSKPAGYDPKKYELLLRVFQSGWDELFNKFDPIPNRKTDTNNHGPFSSDYIGMNYEYPEASYQTRKKIIADHEAYQKGLLYFMVTDKRMPAEVQQKIKTWGLAADEFKDNGNWPYQLYVREARRMLSDVVMTEHEVLGKRPVSNSVGMGSYALDSHNIQRYVTADGFVQNEGDIGVGAPKPYSISYGSIIPKRSECVNLLVPVCISSSHTAYGSVRMEPVFMILGQSAAAAASIAIDSATDVQLIDKNKLESVLNSEKQVLYYSK